MEYYESILREIGTKNGFKTQIPISYQTRAEVFLDCDKKQVLPIRVALANLYYNIGDNKYKLFYGEGKQYEDACENLFEKIQGKTLHYDPYNVFSEHKEVKIPSYKDLGDGYLYGGEKIINNSQYGL